MDHGSGMMEEVKTDLAATLVLHNSLPLEGQETLPAKNGGQAGHVSVRIGRLDASRSASLQRRRFCFCVGQGKWWNMPRE